MVGGINARSRKMRPIKFRAWDKEDKVMYYDVQMGIDFQDGSHYEFKRFLGSQFQKESDYHKWELMQFTDLLDKNGKKEIYEGDILLYKGQPVIVEYVGDMFHCKSTKYPNLSSGNYRLATLCKECEVIGNIWENKELLNGKD